MITLIKEGHYKLIETRNQIKILALDDKKNFAWINVKPIGEILVSSHHPHKTDNILAIGTYRLYNVKEEPSLTDLQHLELFVGQGKWQGYLLPVGMPDGIKRRRIIPTDEVISSSLN